MAIDFNKLVEVFARCQGRVRYKLGAKASLDTPTAQITKIDCSGWVRYQLYHATGVKWPDGSQNQLAYARQHLRKLAKYSDVLYAKNDANRLFIAFLSPKPGKAWPRHVWLVRKAKTMESCSSLGVASREWNHGGLKNCVEVFEVV